MTTSKLVFIIEDSHSFERLDKLLIDFLESYDLSRSRIQKLIKEGYVEVNDLSLIHI